MQQYLAEYVVETASGSKTISESFYMPTEKEVRDIIVEKGGYVLSIRPHERSALERFMARSSWWQVQLLRGIQFRSTTTSPSVALWRLIDAETNPRRQNILSPAREALSRGLGIMDALKSLNIFDHGTLAILAASEKSNRLHEGIPHAIQNITQKKKNARTIGATMAWLGFDVLSIVQAMFWGQDVILGWFRKNQPKDPAKLAEYTSVVNNLELLWNTLLLIAVAAAGFLVWTIISFWVNRGKKDWPTARIVRRIPLIGAYLRDIGFADSASAAARMIRGNVPISETLQMSSEATTVPEVSKYWQESHENLSRGVGLGAALDRPPLNKNERMELSGLADLSQVATVMEAISDLRQQGAKTKHSLIVWAAFGLTGVYLVIAFGSAIFALTVMNMSMDSMMEDLMYGAL